MLKRNLSLLLVFTLLLMAFAACGSEPAETASESLAEAGSETAEPVEEVPSEEVQIPEAAPEQTEEAPAETPQASAVEAEPAVTYPLVEETATLSLWNQMGPWTSMFMDTYDDHPCFQLAEEITNVHIDFTTASFLDATTQFQLMISAGEYTDLIDGAAEMYTTGGAGAIEDEVILELSGYVAEFAPNYSALRESDEILYKETMLDDGSMVCFQPVRDLDNYVYPGTGLMIRQDFLDAVGMDIPETYDELESVLTAFRDQLGVDIPLYLDPSGVLQDNWLAAGYDVALMTGSGMHQTMPFYQVDGAVHYGLMEEGFRDYITMMHNWYTNGLISNDFTSALNMRDSGYGELMASDTVGVFLAANTSLNAFNEAGKAVNPDYNLVAMADLTAEAGGQTHLGNYVSHSGTGGFCITTACEDPELAAQWCDFWFSEQGILIANWGVENESYTLDENGEPHFTELMTNNPNYSLQEMTGLYCLYISTLETTLTYDSSAVLLEQYPESASEAVEIWTSNKDGEYELPERLSMSMTAEESTSFNSYYSDIETYAAETVPKLINGTISLDQMDAVQETLVSMGINSCIELKQAALDRFNER